MHTRSPWETGAAARGRRRHRPRLALVAAGIAAAGLWGCGGGSDEPVASATTEAPAASKVTTTTEAPEAIPLLGDAATNESCALAEVSEIEEQVDAGVVEMRGLTGPGAFAETLRSCTWYLDATEVGIPSVSVQWETPVDSWHDSVIELYQSQIDQGLSTRVEDVGEFAVLQGMTAEAIDGAHIVRVSVLLHAEATPADQEDAVDLLELLLSRVTA